MEGREEHRGHGCDQDICYPVRSPFIFWFRRLTLSHRHGYPFICLERYHVISALYKHVPDKTKVLHGKKITRVDHFDDRVVAQCKDGSSYTGDIIIGADGVHSLVRQEMWRHANLASPGFIPKSQETREHFSPSVRMITDIRQ